MSLKITNTSVTYQDVVDSTPQLTASGTGKLIASAVVSTPLTAASWAIPLTVGGTQVQAPPGAKFLGGYVSGLAFTPGSITAASLIGTPAAITTPTTTPTSPSTIMSSGTLVADTTSPATFGLLATVTVSTTQNSTVPVTSSPYLSLQIADSVALPVGTATVVLYYQL
jgi:hypothetical protein